MQNTKPTGYAPANDNHKLAYYIEGEGFPVFIFNGFTCVQANLKYAIEYLKNDFQVISWDYRGHGESMDKAGMHSSKANLDQFMADANSVFDHLQLKKAHIFGYSMGAQFSMQFAHDYPEKVSKIACLNGIYGKVFDQFLGTDLLGKILPGLPREIPWLNEAYKTLWKATHSIPFEIKFRIATIALLDRGLAKTEDVKPFLQSMSTLDGEFMLALAQEIHQHETYSFLSELKNPSLIIASGSDLFATPAISEKVHRLLPDSELIIISKGTHNSNLEKPEQIFPEVLRFFKA